MLSPTLSDVCWCQLQPCWYPPWNYHLIQTTTTSQKRLCCGKRSEPLFPSLFLKIIQLTTDLEEVVEHSLNSCLESLTWQQAHSQQVTSSRPLHFGCVFSHLPWTVIGGWTDAQSKWPLHVSRLNLHHLSQSLISSEDIQCKHSFPRGFWLQPALTVWCSHLCCQRFPVWRGDTPHISRCCTCCSCRLISAADWWNQSKVDILLRWTSALTVLSLPVRVMDVVHSATIINYSVIMLVVDWQTLNIFYSNVMFDVWSVSLLCSLKKKDYLIFIKCGQLQDKGSF